MGLGTFDSLECFTISAIIELGTIRVNLWVGSRYFLGLPILGLIFLGFLIYPLVTYLDGYG